MYLSYRRAGTGRTQEFDVSSGYTQNPTRNHSRNFKERDEGISFGNRHQSPGRTIDGMLAAAVYIACREMGASRTLKDIAAATNLKLKNVARCYRILVFELGIKIPEVDPIKCVAKVANKLSISEKTRQQAINIMGQALEKQMSAGKDPMGLAATVVYALSIKTGESITQIDMAKAAGVTEVTIRNRFKDLTRNLESN